MKKYLITMCAFFVLHTTDDAAELTENSLRFRPLPHTALLPTNGVQVQIAMFIVSSKVAQLETFVIKNVTLEVNTSAATPTDIHYIGWGAELFLQFNELVGTAPIDRSPTNHRSGVITFEVDTPIPITLADTQNAVALTLHVDHMQGFHTGDKIRTVLKTITLVGTSSGRTIILEPNVMVEQPVQGKEARITRIKCGKDGVTITIKGEPHNLYWIESSTNLCNWVQVTPAEGVPTGIHLFTIAPKPGVGSEFYRAATF